MKVLHKHFVGILLVTLAVFGITTLSSSSNHYTGPVYGFTDQYCESEHYKWFRNVGALIAADGKADPESGDPDRIWNYGSYIEAEDATYTCHLLEYEEVQAVGTVPKKQNPPSGGGGGGEETPTPTPQEPPPEKTPAELQAQNFTEEKSDTLRECVEVDLADVEEEIEGWNSDAIGATEATWEISQVKTKNLGVTTFGVDDDEEGNPRLSIIATIFPQGIGIAVSAMFAEQKDVQVAAFEQMAQFTQVHELFHVGQLKTIFKDTKSEPKPYEWWNLEVQAHKGATRLWKGIHGENVEPPSELNLGSTVNWARKMGYDLDTASYKLLEEELAKPETTEARKKEIKKEMEDLAADLKRSSSLPVANANGDWTPGDIDIDCDE